MTKSEKPAVAFLGPPASFTHQATLNVFPESDHDLVAQSTIEDIFAAVQSSQASYGVVPFENSTNGSVVFTLDLFANKKGKYSDIVVAGEVYLPVEHCLLGHAAPAADHDQPQQSAEPTSSTPSSAQKSDQSLPPDSETQEEIHDQVQTQIEGQIQGQVHDQIHEQIQDQIPNPIEGPTKIAVHSQIDSETKIRPPQLEASNKKQASTQQPDPPQSKPAPTPGAHAISHIRTLYTHPQAWGQCGGFLSAHANLRQAARQDCPSTSAAAALVAGDRADTTRAAIASRLAATTYGLDVLAESIEDATTAAGGDQPANCTRFLIIERPPASGSTATSASTSDSSAAETRKAHAPASPARPSKALVSFTVSAPAAPGALAACLRVFADHGLSLTSINSRPSGAGPWRYVFFVEFREQSAAVDGEESSKDEAGRRTRAETEAAMEDLRGLAKEVRWLGRWEDALEAGDVNDSR